MADAGNYGKDWTDAELDLIVADYFAMLALEQAGEPFVKAHRNAALQGLTGRTHRSIETKHMNISAVLDELGRPIIRGYRPARNYQGALIDAIDRYLSARAAPALYTPPPVPAPAAAFAEAPGLFMEPPPSLKDRASRPERLERLIRKFDPGERDFRNRALGKAGERLVFDTERARLIQAGRADLARKVRWVAEEDGDGAGYDVRSFAEDGAERLLEVKTTCGAARTPFYMTRNELSLAEERRDAFRLFRLYAFDKGPRAFELAPPLEAHVSLEGVTFLAGFVK